MERNLMKKANSWLLKLTVCFLVCAIVSVGLLGLIRAQSDSATVVSALVFGGTNGRDWFRGICPSSEGGFVVVGSACSSDGDLVDIRKESGTSGDAVIIKYNEDAEVVWKKCFGGNGTDEFASVALTSDNGYIAVGHTTSTDIDLYRVKTRTNCNALMVKFDKDGNVVWKRVFGGIGSDGGHDRFSSVKIAPDGYIYAIGSSSSSSGNLIGLNKGYYDGVIAKYDSNGNHLWTRTIGGSGYDTAYTAAFFNNGDVVVTGLSSSNDGDFLGLRKGNQDAYTTRFDSDGNSIWIHTFGGSHHDLFNGVHTTPEDEFICWGSSKSYDNDIEGLSPRGDYDSIIVKYDTDGNIIWKRLFGGSDGDIITNLIPVSDGGYIVCGYGGSNDFDFEGERKHTNEITANDAFFIKLNADRSISFIESFSGNATGTEVFTDMVLLDDDYAVIVGQTSSYDGDFADLKEYNPSASGAQDAFLVKYALGNQPITCTVTFDPQGGTISTEQQTAFFDKAYGELPAPEKVGYTFEGWYTQANGEGELITGTTIVSNEEDHTLYAMWEINTYIVAFKDWDGTVLQEQTVEHGNYATAPQTADRVGYTFTGWDVLFDNITAPLTVTAQYEANTYTVYLDAIDGEVLPESITVTYDAVYGELPLPVLEDYVFNGWYTEIEGAGELVTDESIAKIVGDHTLYAYWVPFVGVKNIKLIVAESIGVGFTEEIKVDIKPIDASFQQLEWISSDPEIATVDSNGMVTGVSEGKVTISVFATDGSGKKDSIKINIVNFAESIAITGPKEVEAGGSINLDAVIMPDNASDKKVTWSILDTSVASITPSGIVNAAETVSIDTVLTIRATAADGSGVYGEFIIVVKAGSIY